MRVTLTLEGNESTVKEVVALLRHISYLGNVGSSRYIHIFSDGDGAAQLNLYFNGEKVPPKSIKDHDAKGWKPYTEGDIEISIGD